MRFVMGVLGGLLLGGMLIGAFALQKARPISEHGRQIDSQGLFDLTNIWTVHLKFTAEQWAAMEPKGGGFGPGGGGPMRFGGPGFGPPGGRPQGGPGGFGPGNFLAPAFLSAADKNHDNKISEAEFLELAEKWFSNWDTNKSGSVDSDKIRLGLDSSLSIGNPFGGPGGPGGRPGGGGGGPPLLGAEGRRNGLASAMGIDFTWVHADLEFDGLHFLNVGVRYKGNGTFMESRNSLKRSLKVDLDKFERGRSLAGVRILNLHNNVTDASFMNEVLSHKLYRDAGVPAPRNAYAKVFVSVPGEFDHKYFGLYSIIENVDADFLKTRFGTRHGALFKPVTRTPFEDAGDAWADYKQMYDPKIRLRDDQGQRVINFCKLVSHSTDTEFERELPGYVDLDEFARFMAVTTYLSTMDSILSMGQNFLVYLHPKTSQLQFIPWDLDHSFGQFPMIGTSDQRENLSINKPWTGAIRLFERVFKHPEFRSLYVAHLKEFDQTIFKPERFIQQVDELAAALRTAVEEESTFKLARFDQVVSGQAAEAFHPEDRFVRGSNDNPETPNRPRFGGGRGFGGPPGFGQPSKPIKSFVKVRSQSIHDQLTGKSEGEEIGNFGFGGPGPGGPGGRFGRPGGPEGFGPGNFLAGPFLEALDADRDGAVTHAEFLSGFKKWYASWNTSHSNAISEDELRNGINKDLLPSRGGPPPGFGPPPGMDGPKDQNL